MLDALPERPSEAIDLSNKMFVKLQFVKGAQPVRGKNAKNEVVGAAGDKKTGTGGREMKFGMKGKKFGIVGGEDGAGDEESEKKVLKPCLYKIR